MNFLQDLPEALPSPQPEKRVSCSDIWKGHTLCLPHLSPCNRFLLVSFQVSMVHSQGWQDWRVHWPSGIFQPVVVLSNPCSYVFIFETTDFSIPVAQTTSPEWPTWERWEAPLIPNSFVITWCLELFLWIKSSQSRVCEISHISSGDGRPLGSQPHIMGCPLLWRKTVEK